MTFKLILACLLFATSIAFGQVLFKLAADDIRLRLTESIWSAASSPILISAIVLYVFTTALWIGILMHLPLSRAYPFALIGAALVPLFAQGILGETIEPHYYVGLALVIAGLFIVNK